MSPVKPPSAAMTQMRSLPHMSSMRRKFVLSPITALAFYTSSTNGRLYLLAGEDNHVKVYDVDKSEFCGDIGLFSGQSVHGIAVRKKGHDSGKNDKQQRILVWGGFSVAILPIDLVEAVISGKQNLEFIRPVVVEEASDWIFEGIISPHAPDELALLTAHNDLIKARYDEHSGRIMFLETVSPSRPILYSGNLSWEEPDCILVAAGTVFGEIVVWKYSTTPPGSQNSSCEILFIFSGHEGSIFGVHVSPTIHLETGESLRLLASCSDDRTIRIWDITDPQDLSSGTREEYQRKILAVRQTGFGDSIEESSTDESAARCLAVAMGHISRIWQVEFPARQPQISGSIIELWSFGEDATAQKWTLSLGTSSRPTDGGDKAAQAPDMPTRTRGQLRNEAIYANHNGKNIWSHAITTDQAGQLLVVTGASDGKLAVVGSRHRITEVKTLQDMPPMPEVVELDEDSIIPREEATTTPAENGLPALNPALDIVDGDASKDSTSKTSKPAKKKKKAKKPVKDFFNRYALLSDNTVLTSTKNGRFFVANAAENSAWEQLFLPKHLTDTSSTYAVVKGSFDASTAYVGTAEGNVFVYRSGGSSKLEHVAKVHGKVSDIFALSPSYNVNSSAQAGGQNATDERTIEHQRSRVLVTVLGSDGASLLDFDNTSAAESPKQVHIPVDRRFIVTSAAIHDSLVILGSRTGYISVHESADGQTYQVRASVEPKTNDCVTSITFLPPKAGESSVNFLTTSRDGQFRIYTLRKTQQSWHVALIHETSPPFGPIIEGASLAPSGDDCGFDLILYGFRSTKFIVWNETQRREIASIECGGGHRTFVYDPVQSTLGDFRLVWTQASQLCFFSQTHASHRALKSGGHGREIKAVAASGDLVATAAEDTTIRIWSYAKSQGQNAEEEKASMRCLAVLESHTAGIQSMKWHKQSHLFSSGGNKEFFIWRLNQLDSAYRGLAVKCEAVYPDRGDDIDLRIMNFDVSCVSDAADDDDDQSFLITMALSNSTLLTYAYSVKAGFRLVAKGSYTGACMTQVRHLHVDDASVQVLTTATDGYMAVWEASLPIGKGSSSSSDQEATTIAEFRSRLVTKLHQSTMKSLDVKTLPSTADDDGTASTSYLVATGGDDNGIGAAHLHRDGSSGRFTVKSKSIVRSAHAAAVTGIGFLSLDDESSSSSSKVDKGETSCSFVLASCSNDQRVKRWEITDGLGERPRFRLLDNRYSAIADAGDLEVLEDDAGSFVVGGVGLEIWTAQGR